MSRARLKIRSRFSEWESSYRAIFAAANDAIFVHDLRTGEILDINAKGCEMYGYTVEEMRQLTVEQLSSGLPPYTQEHAVELVKQAGTGNPILFEWQARNRSGGLFWVEVNLKRVHLCGSDAVLAIVRDITDRKRAEEALAGVSRRLIEAQEQERTRIARDLHDDVAQRLALLAIELQDVQRIAPDGAAGLRTRIKELCDQMVEIAKSVQDMSHELHSSTLTYLGTVAAIGSFCKEFGQRQRMEVHFSSQNMPNALPSEVSLCLFRVVQEALHNAAKHSGVKRVDVQLWGASDGTVHLRVKDAGAGFDLKAAKKRGLGLTSMQERLRLVRGKLLIASQPNCGTTIHACVPLSSGWDSAQAA